MKNKVVSENKLNVEKIYVYSLLILTCYFIDMFIVNFNDSFNVGGGYWDRRAIEFVNGIRGPILNRVFIFITNTGNVIPMIVITIVISGLLYYFKKKREAIFFISNILSISVINSILKFLISRQRPVGARLIEASSYSFPSGHSITSMTFAMLIIYFIIKFVKVKKIIYPASTLIFIYSIFIGLSRVYVGVHYISDVVGAWSIAGLWSFISIEIYRFKICKCSSNT